MINSLFIPKEKLVKELDDRLKIYYKFKKYIENNKCTFSNE